MTLPSHWRHPTPITLIAAGAAALASLLCVPAHASSHREAPFIATQPKVDGTDLYLFNSYECSRSCPASPTSTRRCPAPINTHCKE